LHALSVGAVFLSALRLSYQLSIVLFLVFSLIFYLRREQRFTGFSIRHSHGRGWEMSDRNDSFYPIKILPETVLHSYLIVLNIRKSTNNQKQTILVCNDAMSKECYRKLMVELKINGLKSEGL